MKTYYLFTYRFCICMLVYTGISAQTTSPPKQWAFHYRGCDVDVAFVIKLTTDGGTMVAGYSDSKDVTSIRIHHANIGICGLQNWISVEHYNGNNHLAEQDTKARETLCKLPMADIWCSAKRALQNKSLQRVINVVKMPL